MRRLFDPIPESEVTDYALWRERRRFLGQAGGLALGALAPALAIARECERPPGVDREGAEPLTPLKKISRYNNYFEFSGKKDVIHILAQEFNPRPWTLTLEGELEKPGTFDLDRLMKLWPIEERIYRLRCVEGWSMVIPWNGFPLCKLINRVAPTSRAKYVEFVSVNRPAEMIGQRRPILDWPYREALRIDEASHPLTFIASGLYGKDLPNQNGAPLRLVAPWKYGFKSIKAITHIRFLAERPKTTWCKASPDDYGFFANVNPKVSSPTWSQRREIRIGELRKRKTLMFNGYAEQVAQMYSGMDLEKDF